MQENSERLSYLQVDSAALQVYAQAHGFTETARCAGCGEEFSKGERVWHTVRQVQNSGLTSGYVLALHCVNCEPNQAVQALSTGEVIKQEEYGDDWKFVQGDLS